jgi:hypothetical protein
MPANETRFRCDECGKLTAGRIGREGGLRGDRSGRYPRRHNGPGGNVCPGVFREAVWVDVPRENVPTLAQWARRLGFDPAQIPGKTCLVCGEQIGGERFYLDTGFARFGTILLIHAGCETEGELKNRQGKGYIVETPKVGGIQTIRIGDRNVAKKAAKGVKLSTGAGAMAKATKAKPKKGGASIITPETGADREVAPVGKREQLKTDIANAVAKLSEQVERAEKDLNDAKEVLKEKRSAFNELARKLREESKLLADMVAGRPVPRNLFN